MANYMIIPNHTLCAFLKENKELNHENIEKLRIRFGELESSKVIYKYNELGYPNTGHHSLWFERFQRLKYGKNGSITLMRKNNSSGEYALYIPHNERYDLHTFFNDFKDMIKMSGYTFILSTMRYFVTEMIPNQEVIDANKAL